MKITIDTIKHNEQRYPTVGDWIFDDKGNLDIKISNTGNWKYELLVAVHELIEVSLCKDRGISQKEVDDFDMKFEQDREVFGFEGEPGDEKSAPYHKEHKFATKIEKMLAKELKVNWNKYDKTIDEL